MPKSEQPPHPSHTRIQLDLLLSKYAARVVGSWRLIDGLKRVAIQISDAAIFLRYRQPGLRKYERLLIDPAEVTWGFPRTPDHHISVWRRKQWDLPMVPALSALGSIPHFCVLRTRDNKSWEEAGEIERETLARQQAGKSHLRGEDAFESYLQDRYSKLETLIDETKQFGRLKSRNELDQWPFRERGGIGIVVNADGSIAICDGHHRFGIALGLRLESIPVSLFAVHPEFLRSGAWHAFYEMHKPENRGKQFELVRKQASD